MCYTYGVHFLLRYETGEGFIPHETAHETDHETGGMGSHPMKPSMKPRMKPEAETSVPNKKKSCHIYTHIYNTYSCVCT